MSNNGERSIKIDYLLTLLNMYDDYESFTNDLLILLRNYSGDVRYESFGALFKNLDCIDDDSIKTLINNHKNSIEIIKKYISMTGFMYDVYEYNKLEKSKYSTLEYCYNLILKENLDINKVIKLVEHIEKLGFSIINYCNIKRCVAPFRCFCIICYVVVATVEFSTHLLCTRDCLVMTYRSYLRQ